MTHHTERPLRALPRAGDADEVRRIVAATGFFRAAEVDIAVELVEEALRRGAEASGYHFYFDDAAQGGLAGYACYGPIDGTESSWDFYWIAVDPSAQGQGVGRALLAAAERDAAARGAGRLWVETSTMALYAPTRRFYHRAGYTDAAELPDFYAPGDGKLILVKQLRRP
ncbi:MAG: GNAT family N-acetyltransferase [Planctomycetota bacterium]